MAERNPHDKWGENISVTFREILREAKDTDAVPFGEERLTAAEAKKRFTDMTDGERQRFIAEKGETEVLRMLRGK